MGKGMTIEVIQAELKSTGSEADDFLYPIIQLKESFVKPGWTMPDAPTIDGVVAIALRKAHQVDGGLKKTFIADSGEPPYQENGPWDFSAAVHERHGLTKKDLFPRCQIGVLCGC